MIKLLTADQLTGDIMKSSELAQKTNLPHSKIKRWAREFLPRDPKAKMRSGYTREYGLNEAFDILMGGHLVSDLKFEVHEAKMIISGLRPFLLAHALYPEMDLGKESPASDKDVKEWEVRIIRNPATDGFELFCYGFIKEEMVKEGIRRRSFRKEWYRAPEIGKSLRPLPAEEQTFVINVLKVSRLREKFLESIKRE